MTNPRLKAHDLGKAGEEIALKFLKRKKYRIAARGFRLFRGEIDVIALDKKTLVFIEVKTRTSTKFGLPEEAVSPSKQKQIRKIAQGYLAFHDLQDTECRFDVLSVVFDGAKGFSVNHIKNAF